MAARAFSSMMTTKRFARWGLGVGLGLLGALPMQAFPPAPHHTITGIVRDEFGYEMNEGGSVILETDSGIELSTPLNGELLVDASYRLEVPMDAGVTPDSYTPNALSPLVPFTMRVQIGNKRLLPFEMEGLTLSMGDPGGLSVINLTLGEDKDGDQIPDQWELSLLEKLPTKGSIEEILPYDDLDGDGLTNYEEYLAHTYAYDVLEGLDLAIHEVEDSYSVLRFLVVDGHRYTILGSEDASDWQVVGFRLETDPVEGELRMRLDADEVTPIKVRVPRTSDGAVRLFKVRIETVGGE